MLYGSASQSNKRRRNKRHERQEEKKSNYDHLLYKIVRYSTGKLLELIRKISRVFLDRRSTYEMQD